jgi:hypothetical protein
MGGCFYPQIAQIFADFFGEGKEPRIDADGERGVGKIRESKFEIAGLASLRSLQRSVWRAGRADQGDGKYGLLTFGEVGGKTDYFL